MGFIYVIENQINHKKYVGQTIAPNFRWRKHKTDDIHIPGLLLGKAFLKYGIENFTFTIIEECENNKLSECEIYWIKELNTFVKNPNSWGYNMTQGGEAMFGESNPFYGRTHTKEIKQKLSEYAIQRRGSLNPFFGKHHTEQFKVNRRGTLFFGPNAVKCVAYNTNSKLYFNSIREAYESFKNKASYDWFRKSVRKAIKLHTIYLDYYWCKSVETMGDECSPVGGEIGTPSKCIASELKSDEEIVHTNGNIG